MANSHRIMRALAVSILAGSVATVILSFYAAVVTGYDYEPLSTFRTYNGVLLGSALVLVGVLVAGILTTSRVESTIRDVLGGLQDKVRREVNWPVPRSEVRRLAREFVEQGPDSPVKEEIAQDLQTVEALGTFRRDLRSLLAAPVGLLASIFAISAWALPAETFLRHAAVVNTTLLFFVTYGTIVAAAAVVATAVAMLSARAEPVA